MRVAETSARDEIMDGYVSMVGLDGLRETKTTNVKKSSPESGGQGGVVTYTQYLP